MRIRPLFGITLLLLAAATAWADEDTAAKLTQLQAELNAVRQEQQTAYQSYEMLKEQRRIEVQQGSLPIQQQQPYGSNIYTPPPNYYDVLRQQAAREQRIRHYTGEMMELSDRYFELENQRRQIVRQIEELQKTR
jgi:DNA mismatch repair ATPase MutS